MFNEEKAKLRNKRASALKKLKKASQNTPLGKSWEAISRLNADYVYLHLYMFSIHALIRMQTILGSKCWVSNNNKF